MAETEPSSKLKIQAAFKRYPNLSWLVLAVFVIAALLVFRSCRALGREWLSDPVSAATQAAEDRGYGVLNASCGENDGFSFGCESVNLTLRAHDGTILVKTARCTDTNDPDDCHFF